MTDISPTTPWRPTAGSAPAVIVIVIVVFCTTAALADEGCNTAAILALLAAATRVTRDLLRALTARCAVKA